MARTTVASLEAKVAELTSQNMALQSIMIGLLLGLKAGDEHYARGAFTFGWGELLGYDKGDYQPGDPFVQAMNIFDQLKGKVFPPPTPNG